MVHISFWSMQMTLILVYWVKAYILRGIREKTQNLLVASKESELEVNADKTKYMAIFRDQNAG
jgi:hypothetical protein